MSRPTVVEVNFHEFKRALESALASGTRIVPGDTQRWRSYVAAHRVRETNFQAYVRGQHENCSSARQPAHDRCHHVG